MSRMAPLLDPKLPPVVMSSPNLVPRFPRNLTSCNLLPMIQVHAALCNTL